MIRDLMVETVEVRLGLQNASESSVVNRQRPSVRCTPNHRASSIFKLGAVHTPSYSTENNGMAEAFVKTFKRDYVWAADLADAKSVMSQVPKWFDDYNENALTSSVQTKITGVFNRLGVPVLTGQLQMQSIQRFFLENKHLGFDLIRGTMAPMVDSTRAAIFTEFTDKSARLRRLSIQWIVALVFVLPMIAFLRVPRSWELLPSLTVSICWLLLWGMKGIWDIVEDVLPAHSLRLCTRYTFLLISGGLAFWLTQSCLTLWLVMITMLVGSFLAGGIDTPSWRFLAGMCSIGILIGAFRLRVWTQPDLVILLAAAAIYAGLSALQDRSHSEHWIFKFKLVPISAVALFFWFLAGDLAEITLIFSLLSPHFLVYDLAKIGLCKKLLEEARC
jgi:hypothetical protein